MGRRPKVRAAVLAADARGAAVGPAGACVVGRLADIAVEGRKKVPVPPLLPLVGHVAKSLPPRARHSLALPMGCGASKGSAASPRSFEATTGIFSQTGSDTNEAGKLTAFPKKPFAMENLTTVRAEPFSYPSSRPARPASAFPPLAR